MNPMRSEPDASDLVQETFLAWGRKSHSLQAVAKGRTRRFTTFQRVMDCLNGTDAKSIVQLLREVQGQYRAALALYYLETCSFVGKLPAHPGEGP